MSNATKEYIYEDHYSYVTDGGSIYRKSSKHVENTKIGEAEEDAVEETIASMKERYAELEQTLEAIDEPITPKQKEQWTQKINESAAVGDMDALFEVLNSKTVHQAGAKERDEEPVASENGAAETEQKAPAEFEDETQSENGEAAAAVADDADSSESEADKADTSKDDAAEADAPVMSEAEEVISYYKAITKEAQDISSNDDWNSVEQRLNELSHQWSDGPDAPDDETEEEVRNLFYKFTKATESFENKKDAHFKEAEKKRSENLAKKRELHGKLKAIVRDEDWNATSKVQSLERKWQQVGAVPREQAEELQHDYEALLTEFKSHKVDRLVARRQSREDNLMMKMAVLDKMESVAADIDSDTTAWNDIENTFEDLTKQWKNIGRVPREKSNRVWDRYKEAQDGYYDQKYRHHRDHRSNVDSFTAKKENVIEAAEALIEKDDLAKAARKVNKLHRRWKKIGNLPQRREDDLWDRFKSATDAFNEKKANNRDKIEEQEEAHYQQKLQLIEKADELKTTDDWKQGHRKMQEFMDQWKAIGPVPRKKSNKIWKQFKGAMDVFYDRRREHFKNAKKDQKENLKKKQEILEKLRDLHQHDDPIAAVDEAKKLQAEFKDVGYVPIKQKDEMWQKYREACDVIYDRMRAAKSGNKFDQELAKASLDADQRSQIQSLRKKHKALNGEVRDLKKEVLQLQESKGNFNFSDDDNPLLKDMEQKISKAKAKLNAKENKLEAISMEMDDIRDEGDA